MRPAAVLLLLLVAAAAYLSRFALDGWIPHDEGLLGQSAERVLLGERPHADFDDPYTGGLAQFHALAFRFFGTRLSVLRWILFGFGLAAVATIWSIARRGLSPLPAAAVAATSVVWTLPNYFAALPSWYNLFLALFGLAALLRWLDSRRAAWLFAAGLCGGLSILAKISGLFFVAGACLFLLHVRDENERRGGRWLAIGGAMAIGALPLVVMANRLSVDAVATYALPPMLMAAVVVVDALRAGTASVRSLLGRLAAFGLGVSVPVVAFALPYVASGSLAALWKGVFVLPQQRLAFAAYDPPPLATAIFALPLLLTLLPLRSRLVATIIGIAALTLIPFAWEQPLYSIVWWSVRGVFLGVIVIAACVLLRMRSDARLLAVISVAAFCSLVQFPYSFAIYFCYVAPLVLLSAVFLLRSIDRDAEFPLAVAGMVFVAAFAIVWLNTGRATTIGDRYQRRGNVARLAGRADLDVPPAHAAGYADLVKAIREHARSELIYAFPDCPEVYFLAGKRNPTRKFYDFFDAGRRPLRTIEEKGIDVVVINALPEFSPPADPLLVEELRRRFAEGRRIGPFEVRWKSAAP